MADNWKFVFLFAGYCKVSFVVESIRCTQAFAVFDINYAVKVNYSFIFCRLSNHGYICVSWGQVSVICWPIWQYRIDFWFLCSFLFFIFIIIIFTYKKKKICKRKNSFSMWKGGWDIYLSREYKFLKFVNRIGNAESLYSCFAFTSFKLYCIVYFCVLKDWQKHVEKYWEWGN